MSDLEFKPITEGLGFHPFADGLPYAPGSKSTTSHQASENRPAQMGTGAVAAGVARPVRFPQPAVQTPRPMGTGAVAAGMANPVRTAAIPQVRFAQTKAEQQKAAITQQAHELQSAEKPFGFIYLFERVAAFSLDSALILAGLAAGASYYLVQFAVPSNREMTVQDLAYIGLVVGSLHWALLTFQEVAFGTTLGKRIFGLRVPGSAAAVFLRAFFFVPSLLVAGLGLATALFDSRRRCLHDLIADVQPVRWN